MIIGYKQQFHAKILDETKKHTIRTDAHDRWHAGMKMHQSAGVRTKQYKLLRLDTCTGTQKIRIYWIRNNAYVYVNHKIIGKYNKVFERCFSKKLGALAQNDGFDSTAEFFNWFNENFIGKIIHWTDLRY